MESNWKIAMKVLIEHLVRSSYCNPRRPSLGSNSQLKALAEVYCADGSQDKFTRDFISAWNKVMNSDRFEAL